MSDDGRHGLTIIAFLGSVFSPWYAWARRRPGGADPMQHCALNVALYGGRGRWAMTERPATAVERCADTLRIGPSALSWDGDSLRVRVREVTAPVPRRLRGEIRLHPGGATNGQGFDLDPATGRHRWTPIAPAARVEVALEEPALRWSGPAYFDTNDGDAPLEQDFVLWDWCRAPLPDGGAGVLYNIEPRGGAAHSLAWRVRPGGEVEDAAPAPPPSPLPPTRLWRMPRPFRAEAGAAPAVAGTLEDTPFYARSVVSTRMFGEPVRAIHESLSLNRFRAPWVQAMLPFRVPRARR
ncbi:MAG: carotenoid 1,2-hydratase [Acetobacteraceae bacterium]|nr:carotenoid 1,2-hydratase [Acetobacteraceae bacterium]